MIHFMETTISCYILSGVYHIRFSFILENLCYISKSGPLSFIKRGANKKGRTNVVNLQCLGHGGPAMFPVLSHSFFEPLPTCQRFASLHFISTSPSISSYLPQYPRSPTNPILVLLSITFLMYENPMMFAFRVLLSFKSCVTWVMGIHALLKIAQPNIICNKYCT